MAGKNFCVSFAEPRDADWCLAHGQSILWDNGAFTFFQQGGELDISKLYAWLEPRLGHPHWAVIPDRIGGDVWQQMDMVKTWAFPREFGAPVWHMGLPIDYLLQLAGAWPRICFGSSEQYWQVGSAAWERRADDAFNELAKRHSRLPWVHMLRGLALCGDRWPFASADSVNVARNFKDAGVCPERMARRIDSVQCPVTWSPRMIQQELVA
jgi:hypothetical protein